MRVASIQLEIDDRPKGETLRRVLALLDKARGSDLILLPELWPCGYFSFDRYADESEARDGPIVRALAGKARELGAFLYAGSLVEREGDRLFNTSLLLDAEGDLVAAYRKMHLFGHQSEECRRLCRGDEVVVVPTPWGRAGLSICYDLRFPELYRRMVERGADFFLLTAAWPAARLEPWTLLCRARAIEDQAFVFSCNAAGINRGVRIGGHSLFVDPYGKVLAEAGDGGALLTVDVDPDLVRTARGEFPALQDRVLF